MADNQKALKNFIKDINVEIDNFEQDAAQVIGASVLATHGTLVSMSPVDSGRYKNSHYISKGKPSEEVSGDNFDGQAEAQKDRVKPRLESASYFISNNLDYALALEGGHSTQAPSGVYAPGANVAKRIINKLVARLNRRKYK